VREPSLGISSQQQIFRACKQFGKAQSTRDNKPASLFSSTLHFFTQSPSTSPIHSSFVGIASMSDRADFLAGIAASGCGSMYGIYGDFGTFSGPYPDPSPPGKFFDTSDYDMSDGHNSSDGEGSSDDDDPKFKTQKTSKSRKKSKARKESKLLKGRKRERKMAKRIQRGNSIRVLHRYLGKKICETHIQIPEESVQYLARIATDAHYRYR
jgi:hypothetical protein